MKQLYNHINELKIINKQRKAWLILSFYVVICVFVIIFQWNNDSPNNIIWATFYGGLIISVVWWYWTMKIIRQLIHFKKEETELLLDIFENIDYIKDSILNDLKN